MNLYKDCNNHAKHYYISDSDFMLNYTPYEQDQYNGRHYFLDDSNNFKSQVAREGGLVRRRISKADYEAALVECKEILSDEKQVPVIDKESPQKNINRDNLRYLADRIDGHVKTEGNFIPTISADDMIVDFDAELRGQIDDPHYPTVNSETAKHELFGFMSALKELDLLDGEKCFVMPHHFGTVPHFPQIGEVLRNGHTVDAACCIGIDRYVLAHKDGAPEPYAVWEVSQDGDTYGGHYFTDQMRAQRYFASYCYDWSVESDNTTVFSNSRNPADGIMQEIPTDNEDDFREWWRKCQQEIQESKTLSLLEREGCSLTTRLYWHFKELFSALKQQREQQQRKSFESLIKEYGIPTQIVTDNGGETDGEKATATAES